MTLQDTVNACKTAVRAEAPRIVLTQAQALLALVTLRVQNQGLAGTHYSTTQVPTFFFAKRAFNAGGKAYVKANKKGSYEGFRTSLGLYTASVNLTFTGRMFRSLTTAPAGVSGTVFSAKIVASDQEAAAVVGYNMQRYGDFLAPNAQEATEIAQVGQVELSKVIYQYFPV